MMNSQTPRDLMYSTAVKPVSIASTAQTRKFMPITSGTYTPNSNNIIRIPFNANAFIDLKNAMIRYSLTNSGANAATIDGSAASFISRLNILGPDGSPIETIDNYNRLYHAMSQLERSRDNFQGITSMLEGTSVGNRRLTVTGSAAGVLQFRLDDVLVGTLTVAGADSVVVGDYRFVSFAAGTTLECFYRGVSGGTVTFLTAGSASTVPGLSFVGNGTGVATLTLNGVIVGNGANSVTADISWTTARLNDVIAAAGIKFYAHNLLSTITKLEVLYPAFSVGGQGCVIEITLAPAQEVLQSCDVITTAPSYAINNVELIAPVIQYPDSVVQSFKQMLEAQGSVSMSSVSFQNFVYPLSAGANGASIPLAIRARSLKALYFAFQPNSSSTDFSYPRSSARESPLTMNFQLRVGSQYFPASVVQYSSIANQAEAVMELEKSVSKLADVRHGGLLNSDNFGLSQVFGGLSFFGLDLEASPISFLENGINTQENSLTLYLELSNMTYIIQGTPALQTPTLSATAGNVYIWALFDNTLSILPNGNVIRTS